MSVFFLKRIRIRYYGKSWSTHIVILKILQNFTSSMIMTLQDMRSGSDRNSLNSIPSVMYFKRVRCDEQSSKRIEQPTSWPSCTSISSATRAATLIAATLLGCVHATPLRLPGNLLANSTQHCGIYKYIHIQNKH